MTFPSAYLLSAAFILYSLAVMLTGFLLGSIVGSVYKVFDYTEYPTHNTITDCDSRLIELVHKSKMD